MDLERDEFLKKPVRIEVPFKDLKIARTVLEWDFLIKVPLMKAYNETLITCNLKNLKGTMPRSMKTAFHSVNLHKAIAQLNSVVLPHLIIVDGLQGDLHSESGYDPVVMDRIILAYCVTNNLTFYWNLECYDIMKTAAPRDPLIFRGASADYEAKSSGNILWGSSPARMEKQMIL